MCTLAHVCGCDQTCKLSYRLLIVYRKALLCVHVYVCSLLQLTYTPIHECLIPCRKALMSVHVCMCVSVCVCSWVQLNLNTYLQNALYFAEKRPCLCLCACVCICVHVLMGETESKHLFVERLILRRKTLIAPIERPQIAHIAFMSCYTCVYIYITHIVYIVHVYLLF